MRLSKPFYVGSIAGGLGLAMLLLVIGLVSAMNSRGRSGSEIIVLAFVPMLYGAIVMLVLFYKMWEAIQDGHARTTPGKAVGFLFIPLFNIYWAFQAIWGFAKDYNAYVDRNSIATPKLPEGLFLTYIILSFLGNIPLLGVLIVVVNYFVGLTMVIKICDGVNALPTGSTPVAVATA